MNGGQPPRFRPFTCYFCNKLIDNDTEFSHNSSCGAVLEPCPNKCGIYVPRNTKPKHMAECKNNTLRRCKSSSKLTHSDPNYRNSINSEDGYSYKSNSLGRVKVKPHQYPLVSGAPPSPGHPSDLKVILNKQKNLDQICMQLSQNVVVLKSQQQEALQNQKTSQLQTKMHLDKLVYQYQILSEWRKAIEIQMENFKIEMAALHKSNADLEKKAIVAETSRSSSLASLSEQLSRHKHETSDILTKFYSTLDEFKDKFLQENATVAALWNDQNGELERLKAQLESLSSFQNEQRRKSSSWVFDLKSVSQVASETSEKLELHERKVEELKKELAQVRLDLENRAEKAAAPGGDSMPGHLLWKVSNFQSKLEKAKEHDTVLKSPDFYTHQYGYRAKLHIYLNGIKRWKGRHAILCLQILKGEYDLLLKWPCYIEGTVSIKDLYNTQTNNVDFSKYISSKYRSGGEDAEEPHESSTEFIFIPHTTLLKHNFQREDTMFVDVKINHINRLSDETDL